MFKRLVNWNADRHAWNRDHEEAWRGQSDLGESGLSVFQTRCEAAVVRALSGLGVELVDRTVEGAQEKYIRGRVGATDWTIWIYLNGAQVSSETSTLIRLEEWDAKTPAELIDKLIASVLASVSTDQ